MWRGWIALVGLVWVSMASASGAQQPVQWQYTTLAGEQQQLSDHRGRWVVVNFWATWCTPCLIEIPELVMFQDLHGEQATVLGVNLEDISEKRLKAQSEALLINYPVVHQGLDQMTPFGQVPHLPTTILLDPEGRIAMRQSGGISAETLLEFMR